MDILTGEICRKFRLLMWTPFVGQFRHPVRMVGRDRRIVILGSWEYHFSRVHENLVRHPSNNISILMINQCLMKKTLLEIN